MYEINFHRHPITRSYARDAVVAAHARLGIDQGSSVINAHTTILEQSGEIKIVHAGNSAYIERKKS